jgi:cell division septation protein DedD
LPKNDEGEFELVLGNRQLLSVFAIVVILLGAFFSMGYVVGRNSSGAAPEVARSEKPKPDRDADSDNSSETPAGTSATPLAPETAPTEPAADAAKPASSLPPAVVPAKPDPIGAPQVKPKPTPSLPPSEPPVRAASPRVHAPASPIHSATSPIHAPSAGEPSSGQYWQVVATARPDAEIIAEALGKKGFHVVLAPAPKEGIFRVLVGPLADAPAQAQTRTGLEAAGFRNPLMRKY